MDSIDVENLKDKIKEKNINCDYCEFCGSEMGKTEILCPSCGRSRFESVIAAAPATQATHCVESAVPNASTNATDPKASINSAEIAADTAVYRNKTHSSGKKYMVMFIISTVLLIVAVVGFVLQMNAANSYKSSYYSCLKENTIKASLLEDKLAEAEEKLSNTENELSETTKQLSAVNKQLTIEESLKDEYVERLSGMTASQYSELYLQAYINGMTGYKFMLATINGNKVLFADKTDNSELSTNENTPQQNIYNIIINGGIDADYAVIRVEGINAFSNTAMNNVFTYVEISTGKVKHYASLDMDLLL